LEGLALEEVNIFYGHLVFLQPFGIFCGQVVGIFDVFLVYFPHFGLHCQEKSGNPGWKSSQGSTQVRKYNQGASITRADIWHNSR
jgi:hypothetical protein